MPLNTRAGVAQAPIEPGARCFLWLPCDAPWPLKLCRCIAPVKPLPFETPVTSTRSPLANTSTTIVWPTAKSARSSTRSSTRCFDGTDAALGEVAELGLVEPARLRLAERELHRGVPVALGRLELRDMTRPGLDDGHRDDPVLLVPDLGHAELAPQDSFGSHLRAFSLHANAPSGGFPAERWSGCAVRFLTRVAGEASTDVD